MPRFARLSAVLVSVVMALAVAGCGSDDSGDSGSGDTVAAKKDSSGTPTVDVTFKNYMPAEVLAYLPMFERTDSHSVRFRAKDMAEASWMMSFIGEYRADLTP